MNGAADAESREQIRDIVLEYSACGDRGDFAQLVTLFVADGELVVREAGDERRFHGAAEIRGLLDTARDEWSAPAPAARVAVRHHVANHRIEGPDGDTARGNAYFLVLIGDRLDHWGRYRDEYVRTDGRWRFARRTVVTDGCSGVDAGSLHELKARFHRAIDDKDWPALRALLTDDCEFVFGPREEDRVVGAESFVAAVRAAFASSVTVHSATQPMLTALDDGSVRALWTQHDVVVAPDGKIAHTFGDVEDLYVRSSDGQWRCRSSRFVARVAETADRVTTAER